MKVVEPLQIIRSILAAAGLRICFDLIECKEMETNKTAIMFAQANGNMKCPSPSTTKTKYFWGIVASSTSMGLLGLASIFYSISTTKMEKKAESLSKKLPAVSELKSANSKQIA